MANTVTHPRVKGWGTDSAPENRPGVPMEKETGVEAVPITRQVPHIPIINKRADLNQLTPVFGTSCPPKGLSGLIRRAAYRIPDNRYSHWMLLMLGDRVDVIESTVVDLVKRPSPALFGTLGAAALTIALLQRRYSRGLSRGRLL